MAAITQRLKMRERTRRAYIEWQTKSLAGMIVNTAQITDEGHEHLTKAVERMSMEPDKQAVTTPSGEFDFSYLEDDQAALDRAMDKNTAGSFETLTQGLPG